MSLTVLESKELVQLCKEVFDELVNRLLPVLTSYASANNVEAPSGKTNILFAKDASHGYKELIRYWAWDIEKSNGTTLSRYPNFRKYYELEYDPKDPTIVLLEKRYVMLLEYLVPMGDTLQQWVKQNFQQSIVQKQLQLWNENALELVSTLYEGCIYSIEPPHIRPKWYEFVSYKHDSKLKEVNLYILRNLKDSANGELNRIESVSKPVFDGDCCILNFNYRLENKRIVQRHQFELNNGEYPDFSLISVIRGTYQGTSRGNRLVVGLSIAKRLNFSNDAELVAYKETIGNRFTPDEEISKILALLQPQIRITDKTVPTLTRISEITHVKDALKLKPGSYYLLTFDTSRKYYALTLNISDNLIATINNDIEITARIRYAFNRYIHLTIIDKHFTETTVIQFPLNYNETPQGHFLHTGDLLPKTGEIFIVNERWINPKKIATEIEVTNEMPKTVSERLQEFGLM